MGIAEGLTQTANMALVCCFPDSHPANLYRSNRIPKPLVKTTCAAAFVTRAAAMVDGSLMLSCIFTQVPSRAPAPREALAPAPRCCPAPNIAQ